MKNKGVMWEYPPEFEGGGNGPADGVSQINCVTLRMLIPIEIEDPPPDPDFNRDQPGLFG